MAHHLLSMLRCDHPGYIAARSKVMEFFYARHRNPAQAA